MLELWHDVSVALLEADMSALAEPLARLELG